MAVSRSELGGAHIPEVPIEEAFGFFHGNPNARAFLEVFDSFTLDNPDRRFAQGQSYGSPEVYGEVQVGRGTYSLLLACYGEATRLLVYDIPMAERLRQLSHGLRENESSFFLLCQAGSASRGDVWENWFRFSHDWILLDDPETEWVGKLLIDLNKALVKYRAGSQA